MFPTTVHGRVVRVASVTDPPKISLEYLSAYAEDYGLCPWMKA